MMPGKPFITSVIADQVANRFGVNDDDARLIAQALALALVGESEQRFPVIVSETLDLFLRPRPAAYWSKVSALSGDLVN